MKTHDNEGSPSNEHHLPDEAVARTPAAKSLAVRRTAHDINNLLSLISVNVGLLRLRVPYDSEEAELLDEIADATLRSAKLTSQLTELEEKSDVENPSR